VCSCESFGVVNSMFATTLSINPLILRLIARGMALEQKMLLNMPLIGTAVQMLRLQTRSAAAIPCTASLAGTPSVRERMRPKGGGGGGGPEEGGGRREEEGRRAGSDPRESMRRGKPRAGEAALAKGGCGGGGEANYERKRRGAQSNG